MKIDIKKLKQYREKAGYTQKVMAEKLGVSCISYQYYELGIRNPKEKTIKRMELILDTNIYLTNQDKVESLLNSIITDVREAKNILNVDNIGEMKANDIIYRLEKMMKGDDK